MKRWISAILTAMLLVVFLLPAAAAAQSQYATVTGGWLRLRANASFNAGTINSYYTGTQVKILSVSNNWYKVQTPDNQVGYMYGDYLSLGGSWVPEGETNATVVSGNGYGVRLRTGPGTNYSIVRKYSVGTRVQVLDEGACWDRIRVGSNVGYMMNEFIDRDGTVKPVGDGNATIWSANGYGVRLRSGPGKGYAILGVYSVGTQVKVLSKGYTWDYVQIGSRIGYMMNDYLNYNENIALNAVTINNYSPVVNNVLAVQTLTPAAATVSYEWLRTNTSGVEEVVGRNASYLVSASELGCTFRLRVTGTGSYTGVLVTGATAKVTDAQAITSLALNNATPVVNDRLLPVVQPSAATYTCKWEVNGAVTTDSFYLVKDTDKGYTVKLTVTGTGLYQGSTQTVTSNAVVATGALSGLTIVNATDAAATVPNVGDKLTAQVQPSTASVTYLWEFLDSASAVKASKTTSSVDLDSTLAGYTIKLTVTGTGNYASSTPLTATTAAITNMAAVTGAAITGDNPPKINSTASTLTAVVTPAAADGYVTYQWMSNQTAITGATSKTYTVAAADAGKTLTVKIVGNGKEYKGEKTSAATQAVVVAPNTFTTLPADLTGMVGYAYNLQLKAAGTAPITWAYTGTLPAGLTFANGTISGTPTAAGSYPLSISATNAAGTSQFGDVTLTIKAQPVNKPTVTEPANASHAFVKGTAITPISFQVGDGDKPIKSWRVTGTTYGLSIDSTGTLSGTPTSATSGAATLKIYATNDAGESAEAQACSFTFTVYEPIVIAAPSSNTIKQTTDAVTLTATGGMATGTGISRAWSLTDAETHGFAITNAGVISATTLPADGTYTLNVKVTDTNANSGMTGTISGAAAVQIVVNQSASTVYTDPSTQAGAGAPAANPDGSAATQTVVTLDDANGTGHTQTVTATFGSPMPIENLTVPTCEGYLFNGYWDEAGKQYYTYDGSSANSWDKSDAAVTLTAQWTTSSAGESQTCVVGLDYNDYDPATGATQPGTVTATYGQNLPTLSSVPTRSGYTFTGFYAGLEDTAAMYYDANGVGVKAWEKANEPIVYAHWQQIQSVSNNSGEGEAAQEKPAEVTVQTTTLTLDPNGGKGGASQLTATSGSALTALAANSLPTKDGSVFKGYFDDAPQIPVQYYDSNGNGLIPWDKTSTEYTLYAHWEQQTPPNTTTTDQAGSGTPQS